MIELDSQFAILRIRKRRGKDVLRRLDFSDAHSIRLTVTRKASRSVHGLFVIISVPKNYDMVRIKNIGKRNVQKKKGFFLKIPIVFYFF